jgi:hypothetical protein
MESRYYIGLDVHKRKISYCVKDSGGKPLSKVIDEHNVAVYIAFL